MPEVASGPEATKSVFVPAIQSGTTSTPETAATPTDAERIDQGEETDVTPAVESERETADADVLFVKASLAEDNTWTFSVTVAHPDTGWEDYADGWNVVLEDGTVIKPDPDSPFTRLLLHPHETEQPFTRSQSGIEIPPQTDVVTVRAHDIVDGFGGKEVLVDLTMTEGPGFEVQR